MDHEDWKFYFQSDAWSCSFCYSLANTYTSRFQHIITLEELGGGQTILADIVKFVRLSVFAQSKFKPTYIFLVPVIT